MCVPPQVGLTQMTDIINDGILRVSFSLNGNEMMRLHFKSLFLCFRYGAIWILKCHPLIFLDIFMKSDSKD